MYITFASSALVKNVILANLDRLGGQDAVELVAARVCISPHSNSLEHVAVNFNTLVSQSGMVQGAKNVIYNFVGWYIDIVPSKEDAAELVNIEFVVQTRGFNLRNSVLQASGSNSTSTGVEYVGEVILGKHRVGGVGAARIVPWLKLRL